MGTALCNALSRFFVYTLKSLEHILNAYKALRESISQR
jgi:hypothetical protein